MRFFNENYVIFASYRALLFEYKMKSKAHILADELDYHRVLLVAEAGVNALAVAREKSFDVKVGGDYRGKSFCLAFLYDEEKIFDSHPFEHRLCAEVVDDEQVRGEHVVHKRVALGNG